MRVAFVVQIYERIDPEEPPNYCTVFHHMVKSAGSTMKSILNGAAIDDDVPMPGEAKRWLLLVPMFAFLPAPT